VRHNIIRLRGARTYKSVSEALEKLGRPIAPLGLKRIEDGERRVDADDLIALAEVLSVSPAVLLMPDVGKPDTEVRITENAQPAEARAVWLWLTDAESADPRARPVWATGRSDDEFGALVEQRVELYLQGIVAGGGLKALFEGNDFQLKKRAKNDGSND